jgi:hypothetical protein
MIPKTSNVTGVVVLIAAFLHGCASNDSMAKKPLGLVINEDNSHFFGRSSEKMSVEGLHELVDRFAGTQVTHLFLCPNAMRVNYRSKVWTAVWDGLNPENVGADFLGPWVHNAWLLGQKGLDPYAIWIARCREKGISPWISMRMNDIHGVLDVNSPMHSEFWKAHPEYWRVPGSESTEKRDRALNYGIPDVRRYNLSLIREYLERYDMDGLELDWMRWGFHFKPGHEQQGVEILNDIMREVRRMTRQWSAKRGHTIRVAARVPAVPEYARGLGMDGVAWAKEGLVDMLIPTPFFNADFDIPIEQWRDLLGPAAGRVVLAAGMELRFRPSPGAKPITNDIETLRGFTAAMLHRGADQIYLFNHMDAAPEILKQPLTLQALKNQSRRHIVTFHDTLPPGVPQPKLLPAEIKQGRYPIAFRIYTGPRPETGQIVIRIGLKKSDDLAEAALSASLNSVECSSIPDHADPETLCRCARVVQFDASGQWMQDGYNLVEIQLVKTRIQEIMWVEIYVTP